MACSLDTLCQFSEEENLRFDLCSCGADVRAHAARHREDAGFPLCGYILLAPSTLTPRIWLGQPAGPEVGLLASLSAVHARR